MSQLILSGLSRIMKTVLASFCVFWFLCQPSTNGKTGPSLYTTTPFAVLRQPFTLVCTWNYAAHSASPHALDITWIVDDEAVFLFSSETCNLEILTNSSVKETTVSVESGYLFQSLTFIPEESDIQKTWCCSISSAQSNNVTLENKPQEKQQISSPRNIVYVGSSISFTCTLSKGPLSLVYWSVNKVSYRVGETSCVLELLAPEKGEEIKIMNRSQAECSQNTSQKLTINNASLSDHGFNWGCSSGGKGSKLLTVIVLDPSDLTNNASISLGPNTDLDNDTKIVVCSTPCENRYNFTWDFRGIVGNLSDIQYDSCKHTCSQTLTIYSSVLDGVKTILCTVSNPRTGKSKTVHYQVSTDNEVTVVIPKVPPNEYSSNGMMAYLWGSVGGGLIILVILTVVIVVWRRRYPSKVMEDNVLYEPGGPDVFVQQKRGSKIVMEDNVLYEHGGPDVCEDEKRGGDIGTEDCNTHEKCENKHRYEYFALEPTPASKEG